MDTNICIYIIKQKPQTVLERFSAISPDEIGISMITVAELTYGASKSSFPDKNHWALQQFISPFALFSFGYEASLAYGSIRTGLEKNGTPIGALDTLIAAHALSLNYILVTNNVREFNRIPGLPVENWV